VQFKKIADIQASVSTTDILESFSFNLNSLTRNLKGFIHFFAVHRNLIEF